MQLYQALITLDGWTFLAQICNLMIQLVIFKKLLLVFFYLKDIVCFTFYNSFCNFSLGAHCINRNNTPLDFQLFQQFRYGCYFIAFFIYFILSKHNTVFACPCAHYVYGTLST